MLLCHFKGADAKTSTLLPKQIGCTCWLFQAVVAKILRIQITGELNSPLGFTSSFTENSMTVHFTLAMLAKMPGRINSKSHCCRNAQGTKVRTSLATAAALTDTSDVNYANANAT